VARVRDLAYVGECDRTQLACTVLAVCLATRLRSIYSAPCPPLLHRLLSSRLPHRRALTCHLQRHPLKRRRRAARRRRRRLLLTQTLAPKTTGTCGVRAIGVGGDATKRSAKVALPEAPGTRTRYQFEMCVDVCSLNVQQRRVSQRYARAPPRRCSTRSPLTTTS
jgi:hypothetical protein